MEQSNRCIDTRHLTNYSGGRNLISVVVTGVRYLTPHESGRRELEFKVMVKLEVIETIPKVSPSKGLCCF